MAEPLKIIRRLKEVSTDYAVFERDQVLTETQLNSVVEYLDDQSRLTRTQLLGIGIVGGLWPSLGKEELVVSKGVGVTSDGDLIGLSADTVFDRWLPYDESAPAYEAFYSDGKMLPLLELLAADDKREGKPLAEIGDALKQMVAIAFMESYENDPDLCAGGNCDNRGRTAKNTQRLLLIPREIAEKIRLNARFRTGAELAAQLKRVRASRADFGTGSDAKVDVTSAELFVGRYRMAAESSFSALQDAVRQLVERIGDGATVGLPSPVGWTAGLEKCRKALPGTVVGIQYLHDHAKNLTAVWNELRAALFADDGVLCPANEAFPKHLLLGALADPALDRTGCYPAPWLAGGTIERQRVIRLMRKFSLMLEAFELPKAQFPKIVPSRRESASLEERAIPIYYKADASLRELWNDARRQRGESEDNTGYHWTQATDLKPFLPDPAPAEMQLPNPFVVDQGGHDFFRIEGFLGLKADLAEAAIEKLVRQRGLPISVVSALTHNQRKLIIRGPKFKRTSLHSLHYLLRQDLTSHIKDNIAYSSRLVADVKTAQSNWARDEDLKVKASATFKPNAALTTDYAKPLENAKAQLESADTDLVGSTDKPGPLAARRYKDFVAEASPIRERLSNVVVSVAGAKADLGAVARNDIVSPLDAFAGSKSHLWVDWLGEILKKREDDQKDKLLLSNMLNEHPGLEHAGGVVPGGTFVLVYDDAGLVIGDLMLPYWLDDNDESDLADPALTLPDINLRLPPNLLPIKFIKPLELSFDDFRVTKIGPEIKIQENYSKFFQTSLASLGEVLKTAKSTVATDGVKAATSDKYMEQMLAIIKGQQEQIQGLRELAGDDRMTAATREKALAQAKALEAQLAVSVGTAVEYFAVAAPETVRFEADKAAVYQAIGSAVNLVTDQEASTQLQTTLKETAIAANQVTTGSSALVADQMMNKFGIRIG